MEESLVHIAFPDIAQELFGNKAFMNTNIPLPAVTHWIRAMCSLHWNKLRKRFQDRLLALKRQQAKVDESYTGE